MAIKNIGKFATLKAPAKKIRDSFNNYLQTYASLGVGRPIANGYKERRVVKYVNPLEYSTGTTYIADLTGKTSIPSTNIVVRGSQSVDRYVPETIIITNYDAKKIPDSMPTTTHFHNLRGYLNAVKVSDYVGGSARLSRLYTYLSTEAGADGGSQTVLVDSTNRVAIDETAIFSDYYVPIITWYYEDNSGVTQTKSTDLVFWYFFTANKIQSLRGSAELGSVVSNFKVETLSAPTYFAFSPPYINKASTSHSASLTTGTISNGVVYSEWQTTSEYVCYRKNYDNTPYVMLGNFNSNAFGTSDYCGLAGETGLGFVTSISSANSQKLPNGRSYKFAAYKSINDIIDLFADYGVKLYLDESTANNPPPNDDGKINPDNPSEEIPYYPDNSTEKTPIEQAYITPSTFGQSCVYTPITTKDFLRWICDNTVDVGNWGRLFANPVDVILGINLYNLDIVAHDTARTNYNAQTNILGVSTNIPNYSILDGYNNIVDGGTLNLQAYYGNYADFTSMTYQMFIPFVGFTTLRACDVVNRTLHLYYAVDFATGAAVAFVNSDDRLIYTSPCNVAGKIPVSTSDKNSQMINNTLSAFSAVGGLLGGIASGNVGGGIGSLLNGLGGMQLQTNYANKGSLSSVNIYKLLPAFVERTRYDLFFPSGEQQYLGAKYQTFAGAPSTQFDTLLNCVNAGGFVQSDVVYLTSQTATETEKQQIIDLIKSGIYL